MTTKNKTHIFFVIVVLIFKINDLLADPNEDSLINDLLTNYNAFSRATQNYSETTEVKISLYLSQILEVEEKDQFIATYCWLLLVWNDPRLQWDENVYNKINEIHLTTDKIWKPDIMLYNTVEVITFSSDVNDVLVYSNGDIHWWIDAILKSSCSIDIRYFPFDTQNCSLVFASWNHDTSKIDLIADSADISNYKNNTEFILKNLTTQRTLNYYDYSEFPFSEIDFIIIIERKPFFYVFNMMIPCLVITLVAFIGFCMPASSGEKISIGITTLLSISVLLLVISADLPISDSVPLLGAFYCASMIIVALITSATVFTLNIHHKSENDEPVPRLLQKIFFSKIGKVIMFPCSISIFNEEDNQKMNTESRTIKISIVPIQNNPFVKNVSDSISTNSRVFKSNNETSQLALKKNSSINPHVNKTITDSKPSTQTPDDQKELVRKQWSLLSSIFDRIFFYLFTIIAIVVLIPIVFQFPSS